MDKTRDAGLLLTDIQHYEIALLKVRNCYIQKYEQNILKLYVSFYITINDEEEANSLNLFKKVIRVMNERGNM